jgi:hypothetical protein
VTDTLELSAKRIAERGRDELLSKLRPAFAEAASAHADVLKLDSEQLEQMVQRAADRADGLQWRRALASVATEELGIGLGEALGHPAVQRAQAIVGAPSYEESLATLRGGRQNGNGNGATATEAPPQPEPPVVQAPAAPAPAAPPAVPAPVQASEATAPTEARPKPERAAVARPEPEPEPVASAPAPDPEPEHEAPPQRKPEPQPARPRPAAAPAPRRAPEQPGIRVTAIHLGGVAGLRPGEAEIELRLSDDGLDISRRPGELFGRLTWTEMHGLEVPPIRGLLRRRRDPRAHLVVRAEHGDASFEIPAVAPEELREHLQPLLVRHGLPPAG